MDRSVMLLGETTKSFAQFVDLRYNRDFRGYAVNFKKRVASQKVHQLVAGEHSCIVVITCGEPTEDGQMPVEMVYEGDPNLADFLLHSAQEVLQQELEGQT